MMKKGNSRRNFLSLVGMMTLVLSASVTSFSSKKINEEKEEYVFINGWLLKKKDLNDL